MKAVVYTKYGPPEVLHLEEVSKPLMEKDKVLVNVHAESINAGDLRLLIGILPKGIPAEK